ncbi:MAG: filamentous hemagglutinin N-terminal domain-containing protein, partial [Planctomycetota bacterium]
MGKVRKISKRYYFRQIAACWLVSCMLFALPVQVAMAVENPVAGALPSGHSVAAGSVGNFNDLTPNELHIENVADGTIINWTNFDIGSDAWTEFQQIGGAASAVLNRVQDGEVTGIMGSLTGNGRVFIVNPAGVIFGSTASVNVAQLVASSLDIADPDFSDGLPYTFTGSSGAVVNDGDIIAQGVALLGQGVVNTGTIVTDPGGFVIMAAGNRVVLSQVGSSIMVEIDEMSSATGSIIEDIEEAEVGEVINEDTGTITSPGGTVVLAAGDIYSVPLHPQLEGKAARVETGTGTVTQNGTINADGVDGDGGSIVLTAGDEVVLAADSLTKANGGISNDGANGGEVIVSAYDFGDKEATTYFEADAEIQVKGGSYDDASLVEEGTTFNGGLADISGNHIFFDGSVDATSIPAFDIPDPLEPGETITIIPEGGTLRIDPVTLTIANGGIPGGGAAQDTFYEQLVEGYSLADVDLDLAADDLITVEYMSDGEILGGSGDIMLRNVFDEGGIYFERSDEDALESVGPRTTIRTIAYYESPEVHRDGGNIYMDAGSGDIVAGDLFTGILAKDKFSQPGDIILRTSNGGDITVDTMQAIGAIETQVSAISDGDLTVNGDAESISQQTDNEEQSVFKALLCLIAEGDVILNGDVYKVETKGKGSLTSDIRISAGENVYIATDPLTGEATGDAKITATSRVAGGATQSTAYIVIHAGRNLYDQSEPPEAIPGVIAINGETYVSGSKFAGNDDIMAISWPATGKLSTDTYDNTPTQDGTKSEWLDESTSDPANFFAKIEINNNEIVPLDQGPCKDCPSLPGLPPVPSIFWIVDDAETVSWSDIGAIVDVLANDGDPSLYDGTIFDPTTPVGGTWTIEIIEVEPGVFAEVFKYTPPANAVFTWDGSSAYATYTDTFTYKAEDSEGKESFNTATVTITVTNFLPTLSSDSDSIHMSTASDPTSSDFDLSTLVTDPDGTPGTISYGIVEGLIPVSNGDIATDSVLIPDTLTIVDDTITYSPLDGYVSPTDSPTTFGYTVTDSSIVDAGEVTVVQTEDLEVTVTNAGPIGDAWLGTTAVDTAKGPTALVDGGFTDVLEGGQTVADVVSVVGTDFDGAEYLTGNPASVYGGDLTYDAAEDEWTYTPDTTNLPGYFGDDNDTWGADGYAADEQFTVNLTDGQKEYTLGDGVVTSAPVITGTGTVSVDINRGSEQTGDGFLGIVHMDTDVTTVGLIDDGTLTNVDTGTYTGSVFVGATLEYDEGTDTWIYTPADAQAGYTGDSIDNWGEGGYLPENQDETFIVDLNSGENAYAINPNPEGPFLVMDGDTPEQTFTPDAGTVTVELSNVGPLATGGVETEHMATPGNMFTIDFGNAQDNEDTLTDFPGQTVLDDITVLLEGGT